MKKVEIIGGGGGYIVAIRSLIGVSVVLAALGILCNISGCGPGSTDPVGTEANVASNNANGTVPASIDPSVEPIDNTPPNSDEPFENTVVNGVPCELPGVVLYDADGNPTECVPNSTLLQAFCNGEARFVRVEGYEQPQQVCEYEPPPATIDPAVEHEAACKLLNAGDGQWFSDDSAELPLEVGCMPTDDGACAVTTSGEGSLFKVTFVGTEFPLTQQDGTHTRMMDITEDGRLVQRRYVHINGIKELGAEAYFQR